MNNSEYVWIIPPDTRLRPEYSTPRDRAVWVDATGRVIFHTDQRVTVPDVTDTPGTITGFDDEAPSIGVLFDGNRHPIYFDVDMVQPADSNVSGEV